MASLIAYSLLVTISFVVTQDQKLEPAKATPAHELLKKFVGEWECESESSVPGLPPFKTKSTMTAHMIGEFWVVFVIKGEIMGISYHGQGSIGYSSIKKRYQGTWIDSMGEHMWVYDGSADGTKLMLDTEGPNPTQPDKTMKARDTWQLKDADTITLVSEFVGPDGKMVPMMRGTCVRKKEAAK